MEHGAHKLKKLGWVALLPLQKLSLLPSSTEIVIAPGENRTAELKNSEYQMCSVLWLLAWLLLYSSLFSFISNTKYLQRCQTYFSRPTHTWRWLWENRNLTMKTITNLTPLTQSLEGETRSKLLSTKRLTRVRVFHNVTTWLNLRQIIKEQITTPRPFKHPFLTVGNDGNKFPNSSQGLSELFERRENPQNGRKDGRRVSVRKTIWVEQNGEQFRNLYSI